MTGGPAPALWLALILAAAAAARVVALGSGLPDYPQADEPTLVGLAARIGAGDPNPHFFKYGTAWPYTLTAAFGGLYAIGRALGRYGSLSDFEAAYFTDPTAFFLAGRALSAALGVATVALVGALGRRLGSPLTGLLAATALALAPLHVTYCRFLVTDAPLTFAVALSLWLMVRHADGARPATIALPALAAGLAASVKYPGAVLALPLLVTAWWGTSGAPLRARLARTAGAAVALAAGFLAGTPWALLDRAAFLRDVVSELQHARQGHYPQVADRRGLAVYLLDVLPGGLGAATTVLAAAGLVILVADAVRRRRPQALAPVVLVAPLFALIAGSAIPFDRYALPLFPALCVAAAVAAVRIAGGRPVVLAALAVAVLAPSALASVAAAVDLGKPDTRDVAARWIADHVAPRTALATELYGPRPPASPADLRRRLDELETRGPREPGDARQLARWRRKVEVLERRPAPTPSFATYTLVHGSLTADASELPYSLAALGAAEVRYVVLTSTMADRFRRYPASYPDQVRFHRELAERGRPVFAVDAASPDCPALRARLVAWGLGEGWCRAYRGPALSIVELPAAGARASVR